MPRRRRSYKYSPQRRKFIWARRLGTTTVAASGVHSINLLDSFETAYGANLLGATLVRIRGVMAAVPATATNTGQLTAGALVLPSATTVADVTPITEPFADWLMWEPFAATGANVGWPMSRLIDNQASRKIEELDQELRLVVANHDAIIWNLWYNLSLGLKLP